jgi:cytochrome c oxidase cbb3-type subunit I
MWRDTHADGTLVYSFVEAVRATAPYYFIRFLGGLMFLSGMLLMAYNMARTMMGGQCQDAVIPAPQHV